MYRAVWCTVIRAKVEGCHIGFLKAKLLEFWLFSKVSGLKIFQKKFGFFLAFFSCVWLFTSVTVLVNL